MYYMPDIMMHFLVWFMAGLYTHNKRMYIGKIRFYPDKILQKDDKIW